MKIKILLVVVVFAFVSGCASLSSKLNPQQKAYADKIQSVDAPLLFNKADGDKAWDRATKFFSKFAEIEEQTENTIKTKRSSKSGFFQYVLEKVPNDTGYNFDLELILHNSFAKEYGNLNTAIIKDYLRTGKLPHPELFVR